MSQEELEQLTTLVAEALSQGESPDDVSQKLINNGWDKETADHFVNSVALRMASAQHSASHAHSGGRERGGGGMGWLVWIGAILFINFLSWLFGWPFWVY
jgi:hypothetical protein